LIEIFQERRIRIGTAKKSGHHTFNSGKKVRVQDGYWSMQIEPREGPRQVLSLRTQDPMSALALAKGFMIRLGHDNASTFEFERSTLEPFFQD
jgi:hypothetical protein